MQGRTHVACGTGTPGRPATVAFRLAMLALMLLLVSSLAACALPGIGEAPVQVGNASSTVAPSPTATLPPPWMGKPHTTPPGWHVYHASSFALALPPDWWVEMNVGPDKSLPTRRINYLLYSPEEHFRVAINVWDQLTPTQFHDDFCTPLTDQLKDTFAGLPMRYTTGDGNAAAFERIWTFASDSRIVYQLWTDDGPSGAVTTALENRAVLETFAPQYAKWGCG